VPIDVNHLPESAQELGDLTARERDLLALIRERLALREIAERLALNEATVYLVIDDLLDALQYKPPGSALRRQRGRWFT
jgi:DNA-binding NarL/FixJ family response regulator